ncbi:UNVERIFIED_CONTAM: hypothetical protein HDU68_003292 [Siphonaria sp. JEL0065]|nr:hypothetical protein HDU68_003292 [Siphonaria sp. JEL0065]
MEVIRLLDSKGDRVLDSVAAEYEDSFCLETFGDLIASHDACEPKGTRSFIIARVQTWDHKQPDSKFFSYYNAYHLNKILFQTQVYLDKKLIHRLNVLNPLSNTDIIGNVQYFMVKTSRHAKTNIKRLSKTIASIPIASGSITTKPPTITTTSAPTASKKPDISISIKTNQNYLAPSNASDLPPPSPSVQQIEAGEPNSWTIASPSVATFLEEDSVPNNPTNTPSSVYEKASKRFSNLTSSPRKKTVSGLLNQNNIDIETGAKNETSLTIQALISPVHLQSQPQMSLGNGVQDAKVIIPEGSITRFARPISVIDALVPKTHKSRRRTLSYLNAINAAGRQASFEEWLLMVKEEQRVQAENVQEPVALDYDVVNPFGSPKHPGIPSPILEGNEDEDAEQEELNGGIKTYDAILFATDDDFLESSKVRAIFRDNALAPEEAKLFEMTPVTSEPPASPELRRFETDDEISACEWCFPTERELRKFSVVPRFFHRYKCYMILAIFIGIIALFTLKLSAGYGDNGNAASLPTRFVYPTSQIAAKTSRNAFAQTRTTTNTRTSATSTLQFNPLINGWVAPTSSLMKP